MDYLSQGKWVEVMPYSDLMPSMPALQQAMREPLSRAPHDHNKLAVYIFERAREIDHEWALAKTLTEQRARSISKLDCATTTHSFR